ncbi:hypothetical protein B296_00058389 [Ensete ventricosum]|uniref:Uncharacterized protein n=1 Tax=Ensete ventricosum TaxID=4639 RepID=A0A426WYJ7_ENSVE|nr:hypothetical protein B296_00058389 [Ensete ventricosum]
MTVGLVGKPTRRKLVDGRRRETNPIPTGGGSITLTRGGLRRWAESNPMAEPTDWPRAGPPSWTQLSRGGWWGRCGGGSRETPSQVTWPRGPRLEGYPSKMRRRRLPGPPRLPQSEAGEAVPFSG